MAHQTRIMHIECKDEPGAAWARIGRVTYSKTMKTLYYQGKMFRSLKGGGFKANYIDDETMDFYWISGCKKDGSDALYSTIVSIDEDVREEYWTMIRKKPELKNTKEFKSNGKYAK